MKKRRLSRMARQIPLIMLGLSFVTARAAEMTKPDLALTGGMVFDGTGAPAREETILIGGGRIVAIGPDVTVPSGLRVIALHGAAVTPGLYDLHTHWTPAGSPADIPGIAQAYLRSGVTTVSDFNEAPEAFAPLREWLSHIPSPHVNYAARISTPGGHGADWADENTTRWISSPDSARAALDAVAAYHPDLIKIFTDGWRYGHMPDNTSMNEATLGAAVAQAHRHGLKVMTHTVTIERGLIAARAGVDALAHGLQDHVLTPDEAQFIRSRNMGDIPTLSVYDPAPWAQSGAKKVVSDTHLFDNALANVGILYRAGVVIGVGTDAGMPATPHGASTLHELELLVRAGLTPAEALVAATRSSAYLLAQDHDRGTLAPGMRADLAVFDGRPWEKIGDIHHLLMTFVDGHMVFGPQSESSLRDWMPVPPARALPAGSVIDDFERIDGRTPLDTLPTEAMDRGPDRSVEVLSVIPRESGEGHILVMTAQMAAQKAPYAGVVFPLSRGAVLPVDVGAGKGIAFEARGRDCPAELIVTGLAGTSWSAPFAVRKDWSTIHVAFTDLRPVKARNSLAWSGRDVTAVELRQSCPAGSNAWLSLDTLRLE
ncbi:amidohydrolase family protein [Asaia krungthepensis]|uniref:Amidohydrolase n=1 Tax=Asaia krungthepensis NRIC 0535 TaxID=1307925 RepID=A0ABQ0PVA5_9PROT|nr:amidohydrolase family protein [Asaia krungthepensis]GBQ82507.1 amidohydrolase [Asaia krungthepensis NRIC 0535]